MLILIIDDEEQIRAMLSQLVQMRGYEAITAENGMEGLALQRRRPADLVITDLIMPEQEGLETIISLRHEFPATRIIAMSGGGRLDPDAYLPAARELGADQVFCKPFDIEKMITAIRELIGDARA